MIRIGIDASGGDFGIKTTWPAAVKAAQANPEIEVVVYSRYSMLDHQVKNLEVIPCKHEGHELRQAFYDLSMDKINAIITAKKSSRLRVVVNDNLCDDIKEPALIAPFPTEDITGISYVMDVGMTAKVTDPETFVGWWKLGTDFLKVQKGIVNPTTGLHNIAIEKGRGGPEINTIDKVLKDLPGYQGFVEPKAFFAGKVHLLLTDGFDGNGMLKRTESLLDFVYEKFYRIIQTPNAAEIRTIIDKERKKYLSYDAQLISPLLGIKGGMVFRVHGDDTSEQIASAFKRAVTKYNLS